MTKTVWKSELRHFETKFVSIISGQTTVPKWNLKLKISGLLGIADLISIGQYEEHFIVK